jgi:hypothetical protein
MDHDPQAHRESQSKPNEIARGLVYGRKAFALGAADAHRHGDECPDKQRSKYDSQYSQPIGMLCAAVPPLDGLGCSGVALKNSIWRYSHLPCRWCDSRRKNST